MRPSKWNIKLALRLHFRRAIFAITLVWLLAATTHQPALGQESKPSIFSIPDFSSAITTAIAQEIATQEVRLDGYKLFAISAPLVKPEASQSSSTNPLKERVEGIETILNRTVQNQFDPAKLIVNAKIDATTKLPIISINGQYLMTVTTLDAQIQGRDPVRHADELTRIIKAALIRAHQERQPPFLWRQTALAGGILLTIFLINWGLQRWQRHLRAEQQALKAQLPALPPLPQDMESTDAATVTTALRQQMTYRRQRDLTDVQLRFLQIAQMILWGGSGYFLLGLFPYTRWLRPLLLAGPLKVLAIILGTYIVVRLVDVLIDRFFDALEESDFISPEASQRLTLRVSTFSRVLKSVAAIVLITTSVLTILSVVGVKLAPVLAGAGIIGLAISFAAQSLVKDMINGLLILFEDQYAVGDVIAVGNVSGLVESMNLRITQLRNSEGRLITIPNSAISVVENLSKDWSRVDLSIVIAYEEDMDLAIAVIKQVGIAMLQDAQWQTHILESPEVLGIDDIDNAGITIRIWIKTQPLQQWNVAREFRRRLKLALDAKGISIGVPQQTWRFQNLPEPESENPNKSD
ncbi:MAG: mechanosensitive ion channel family protein [Scytolyngbya sp. HA4215-MV1]|jgi:small conductance mechanosensitive channel|nr:mechanosensitive ion channel family protein [Scytolyngbya sp. HA4215-MV1]